MGLGHHDAPDSGAFLPRFRGHFTVHLGDEEIKFRRPRLYIRPQHRTIQTVLFRSEAHGVLQK